MHLRRLVSRQRHLQFRNAGRTHRLHVQAYGSKRLDASLLLLPLVGFLPATDPRISGTLEAIEQRLLGCSA